MTSAAIIVAAGRGTRAGGGQPKQWRDLGGRSVAEVTVAAFQAHIGVSQIILVLHADDIAAGLWAGDSGVTVVAGGATRSASVAAGLAAVPDTCETVLIHDVARPLVPAEVIDRVLGALEHCVAAAPALPVTDALWRGEDNAVAGTVDRTGLYRAQTPQGFRRAEIVAAHAAFDGEAADDVEVARAFGLDVRIVMGDERNLKITYEDDFARAARLMRD